MDLFTHAMQDRMKTEAPLAARMRPRTLDEYIGQEHIVGPGQLMPTAGEGNIDFIVGFDPRAIRKIAWLC